jgi:hypothetical protein
MCFRAQSIARAGKVFCMATIFRSYFKQHIRGWAVGTQGRGCNCLPGVEWRLQQKIAP